SISRSPTTSFAAKPLNSSSPPVFSLIVPHHLRQVSRPTPAGHEVCTFQVVVFPDCALATKGAATAAVPPAAVAARNERRRVRDCCACWTSVMTVPRAVFHIRERDASVDHA